MSRNRKNASFRQKRARGRTGEALFSEREKRWRARQDPPEPTPRAPMWWPAFAAGCVTLAAALALLWWAARYGGAG